MDFTVKTMALALSVLWCAQPLWAQGNQQNDDEEKTEKAVNIPSVYVDGTLINKDEIGYNRVYTRDVVNLYKGKQEVETYKGNTVSDLFNGMVGVYSGDARNSGALDPNIRGVQGEGRIPVTVDGTEQSITVWRGYAGVNNRNYVDPSLISSIYIEKGPSLNPEIHSGIAGSVAMKTIDADDIVPEGQKYGIEIKAETGNNAISPRGSTYTRSQDYRTTPDPMSSTLGIWRVYFDGSDRQDQRFNGRNRFFKDNAVRIAAATKQENFDAAIAYAYRDKGNYFSGTKGAEKYGWDMVKGKTLEELQKMDVSQYRPTAADIAVIYHPGGEVTNTSLSTRSWLGKFTVKLPADQKIKFGARYTDTTFGEIMPSRIIGPIWDASTFNKVGEWNPARVKQQAYHIDYAWKPEGSRWIDVKASLWTTRTNSHTNSAGGAPGDVLYLDTNFTRAYAAWHQIMRQCTPPPPGYEAMCEQMKKQFPKPSPNDAGASPNTDGRFNNFDGSTYRAQNNRIGFNLSNRVALTDKLELTLMGSFQHETLKAHTNFDSYYNNPNRYKGEAGVELNNVAVSAIALPRNGKRQEANYGFNFTWRPTSWLTLTAGARHTAYELQDDYIKERLQSAENSGYKKAWLHHRNFISGLRVGTPEEYNQWKAVKAKIAAPGYVYNQDDYNYLEKFILPPRSGIFYANLGGKWDAPIGVWEKDKNGRFSMEGNPLPKLGINPNEEGINPVDGKKVRKYVLRWDSGGGDENYREVSVIDVARAAKQKGRGWAPMASATLHFSDNARAYVRYSEHLRYPSIFEGTIGFSNFTSGAARQIRLTYDRLGYNWLPEHAKNWEIGYVHDVTNLLPKARYADFRINYYHNTTHNIIDRDDQFNFYQYDKQILSGVELQTRMDFGRVFGDLAVTRTLKTQVCDQAQAVIQTIKMGSHLPAPECQNGGMDPNSYLSGAISPRWSVTANLGARFLDNKLEVGSRFTYHSRVYDTRSQSFTKAGLAGRGGSMGLPWQPVAVYDAYLRYRVNKHFTAELVGNNLTNRYYLDPMSNSYMPAPGRSIKMGLSGKF